MSSIARQRCRANRHFKKHAGFLLVEALAAMAIGAFLLVALASAVSLMLRASQHTSRENESIEGYSRVMTSVLHDVAQIMPLRWAGNADQFVFAGTAASVSFAQQIDNHDGTLSTRMVVLRDEGGHLFRSEGPLPPTATALADLAMTDRQVMSQRPMSVRFGYYQPGEHGGEVLTDTWNRTDLMPVGMRLSLVDASGRQHGSVRVNIRVDAELGCAAPKMSACSLAPSETPVHGERSRPEPPAPIDPDDALGWRRYLQ